MRIAFYAPLKPIDHPVPSGDRLMARAFVELLGGLGHEVVIASRLRTHEGAGDAIRQAALQAAAEAEAQRLIADYRNADPPDLWFTYHAYHKAPDWLGPAVSAALGLPYVIAEASIAGKQNGGPWDLGHHATIAAVNAASLVLAMTTVDAVNLEKWMADRQKLRRFPPFLLNQPPLRDRAASRHRLAARLGLADATPWLITVAMMRNDTKLASYRLLAETLTHLGHGDWQLLVAGDGEARAAVQQSLIEAAGDRVHFLGRLPSRELAELYRTGDIFVWPALREAYGMAILEALAAGLPVVACPEGGVPDLIEEGCNGLLAADCSAAALAVALERLLADPALRRAMGERARGRFQERHSRVAAEARLKAALEGLVGAEPCRPCG